MPGYIILAALVGGLIGYFVFYLRYQHKDTVNQLRSNLKDAAKEVQYLSGELDEYVQQNALLKQKTTELLEKNDDLNDVVSELSKYYVHIKRAAEKSSELSKFLQEPNPNIEEKMQPFLNKARESVNEDKKFF
jgi:arginine deiminase